MAFKRPSSCYFTLYRNITLTNIQHFQNICYCKSFQIYKVSGDRGPRGTPIWQFPVSAVMPLLTAVGLASNCISSRMFYKNWSSVSKIVTRKHVCTDWLLFLGSNVGHKQYQWILGAFQRNGNFVVTFTFVYRWRYPTSWPNGISRYDRYTLKFVKPTWVYFCPSKCLLPFSSRIVNFRIVNSERCCQKSDSTVDQTIVGDMKGQGTANWRFSFDCCPNSTTEGACWIFHYPAPGSKVLIIWRRISLLVNTKLEIYIAKE
jgi:hypothetical protein